MKNYKTYILKFFAPQDGLQAFTHIDAEDDIDAMEQAFDRINRRASEGVIGEHVLTDPGGRVIELIGVPSAD